MVGESVGTPRARGVRRSLWRGAFAIGSIAAAAPGLQAATYCAHDSAEFAAALADVSTDGIANGNSNTIHLVAGTFTTPATTFTYHDASGSAFVVDGGYDSNCASQDLAPGVTRLDGAATYVVLHAESNGQVELRHLTFQHGKNDGSSGAGIQVYLVGTAKLFFENNQVLDNSSGYATAGLTVYGPAGDAGTVHIDGNLFAGNVGLSAAALSTSMGAGSTIYLTNNTIAGNTNTNNGNMITALGGGAAGGYVSNNISYANTNGYDYYLYSFETFEFDYNDYHQVTGAKALTSTGNIDVDPKFVNSGSGDYHLASGSPLSGYGISNPAGGLPARDLDGNAFPVAGRVDLGALTDTLFVDGFDGAL